MAETNQNYAAVFVSIAAIIGLVILNIFSQDVPESVNFGLVGAALGASFDEVQKRFRK